MEPSQQQRSIAKSGSKVIEDSNTDRREFITRSIKTVAGLSVMGLAAGRSDGQILVDRADTASILSFEPLAVCELTCSQTLGPCYAPGPLVRRDITSGKQGMPVTLGFRVVDTTCTPISNASVDIWHTDTNGVYSALAGFCANGDPNAPSQNFLRGVQNTDSDGWAYFDTIYPGWYPSRATHIHATIRIGTTAIVTTQFYFLDRINRYVYRNHPLYLHRPVPQTGNTTDGILGGSISRMMPYIFSTKFLGIKPFKAWKTVVINTSPSTCNA